MGLEVLPGCVLFTAHVSLGLYRSRKRGKIRLGFNVSNLACASPKNRARLTHLRIRIIIAYALLTVTYLATALTLLLSCQPFHKFWQINPDPGDVCQPTRSKVYVFICFIPNVVTDIYLSTIPLPVSSLVLPKRKKVVWTGGGGNYTAKRMIYPFLVLFWG